ncbi:hypothetical protein [Specibacter cremeus]|uniref:hypothetical protein n=1 Tax=Specibacter cremeus TaxID=1629051 RepID=UPI000F79A7E5|nr:hypothetical protein [Specibacter cremeus]
MRRQVSGVNTVHRETAELGAADIVRYLFDNLGPAMTAALARKSVQSVRRYADGSVSMPDATEKAMRDAHFIFRYLAQVDSPHTVRAWFMGMNPQLDDLSPLEVLIDGRHSDVLAAAKAFVTGG